MNHFKNMSLKRKIGLLPFLAIVVLMFLVGNSSLGFSRIQHREDDVIQSFKVRQVIAVLIGKLATVNGVSGQVPVIRKRKEKILRSQSGVTLKRWNKRLALTSDTKIWLILTRNTKVDDIARSTKEQDQGIEHIKNSLSELDKATQQNATHVEQTASAAEELNVQAANMDSFATELREFVGSGV